jgi:hypothetical protein
MIIMKPAHSTISASQRGSVGVLSAGRVVCESVIPVLRCTMIVVR